MKLSEVIAIGISVIALSLSSVNTYYQFFLVRNTLFISSHDLLARDDGYRHAELSISNAGNRSIAVTNIHFCMMSENAVAFETAGTWTHVDTYVDGLQSDIVLAEPLIIISPGEMRIFRLKSKFEFAANSVMLGRSFNTGICLTVYTSEGKETLVGLMPFWMEVDDQGKPGYPQQGPYFQSERQKKIDL